LNAVKPFQIYLVVRQESEEERKKEERRKKKERTRRNTQVLFLCFKNGRIEREKKNVVASAQVELS